MKQLRQYIRELLSEATEYDSKFKPLMDSGYDGIKQAMELADTLGIPSQELPWTEELITDYLHYETAGLRAAGTSPSTLRKEYNKLLANTGPAWEERWSGLFDSIGLQEATEYDDKFKPLMDSGPDGIKQAMELADSLGIPSQELPWDFKSISDYVHETVVETGPNTPSIQRGEKYRKLIEDQLANVGWTWDDWAEAVRQDAIDFNTRFSRERK